jgi:Domain of unknown function (DUF6429)
MLGILALRYSTLLDGERAWKGSNWDVMNRFHETGFIADRSAKPNRFCRGKRTPVGAAVQETKLALCTPSSILSSPS